jgi:hypothetical protein
VTSAGALLRGTKTRPARGLFPAEKLILEKPNRATPAQELGEVDAADEAGAIREAARAFQVRYVDIPRLAARRVR